MAKVKIDVCDMCDEVLKGPKDGIIIKGEEIEVQWAGRNSPPGEIFDQNGQHAPMMGRVSLTLCKTCLWIHLEIKPTDSPSYEHK